MALAVSGELLQGGHELRSELSCPSSKRDPELIGQTGVRADRLSPASGGVNYLAHAVDIGLKGLAIIRTTVSSEALG
jgi:hypothetical protein